MGWSDLVGLCLYFLSLGVKYRMIGSWGLISDLHCISDGYIVICPRLLTPSCLPVRLRPEIREDVLMTTMGVKDIVTSLT